MANIKLKLLRILTKMVEHIFGIESLIAYRIRGLIYDEIDYQHGPSQLAEGFAKLTGYWNRWAADEFLWQFPKDKRKELRPIVYEKFQVRKY